MAHRWLEFPAPAALRTRGTVVVVPGRGEDRHTYRRLGARIAADAYLVRVVDAPALDAADPGGALDDVTEALAAATADSVRPLVRPLVLVGADSGAVTLAALTARIASAGAPEPRWWPDALVLAGIPGHATRATGSWDDELELRTSCPVHRGVLAEADPALRGNLAEPVPEALLDLAHRSTVDVPHLLLVGNADALADHEALARLAKSLPRARLSVVRGGHHDVLNDLQHRSVAAEIVSFLEALRGAPPLVPVVTARSSTW
jgi:alpha-beta hydrolase superfamily lysophospholipase